MQLTTAPGFEFGYTFANGARPLGSRETSRDTKGGYSGTARAG